MLRPAARRRNINLLYALIHDLDNKVYSIVIKDVVDTDYFIANQLAAVIILYVYRFRAA